MDERWDAVVVGAGIGGLTAAARLVKEGLRVLVVESDPHPGGTAYVYHRGDFDFPMGPLGFSSPEVVGDSLARAGIDEVLDLERVYYELSAFGLRAPLSLPYPEMVTRLTSIFPQEEAAISRFFAHMKEISSRQGLPDTEDSSRPRKTEAVSAERYLDGLIDDWRLRRILGSMGSREPFSGLPLLAAMWSLLCDKGILYPRGGMRYLCDILAARIGWEAGSPGSAGVAADTATASPPASRLLLRTDVSEILVEGGKARGIVLSDGTRMEAAAVISNADYKATFMRLISRSSVPDELHQALSAARQTSSNLQVCLGLDASRIDLSAYDDASRLIYRRDGVSSPPDEGGLDWFQKEIDPHDLAGEELEATLLSADDPLLAPPGKAVLVIRVAAAYRHFTRFRPQWRKRTPDYMDYKTRLAEALVEEVSNIVPGLREATQTMDIATPLTFEERGGRSEGAVAGWSWDYDESTVRGTVELVRTPISGLYMAGYQAFSMLALGGVPSAMLSGIKAAEYLLAGEGPVSEVEIPG
jgi:all-trans-retinol 13,14-reductase